jgi:hypothetical protein
MSELHLSSNGLADGATLAQVDAADRPLPYRQAVLLVFALSLGLWALLWQAGAMLLHMMFG